jgi:hypothetical protein
MIDESPGGNRAGSKGLLHSAAPLRRHDQLDGHHADHRSDGLPTQQPPRDRFTRPGTVDPEPTPTRTDDRLVRSELRASQKSGTHRTGDESALDRVAPTVSRCPGTPT